MENVQEKAASPSNGNGKDTIEIKSKFDAEFRRFSLNRRSQTQYEDFQKQVEELYKLQETPFIVCYTDIHGDLLPVNNDDNYMKALSTASPLLRIIIQRKGESYGELNGYGSYHRKRNPIISKLIASEPRPIRPFAISLPEDFRRVSAIIDVDVVPETCRRVKLMKNGSDKPLGFYIRDGTSVRVTEDGLEKVAGIFISRLVPGGLAEMTGLIAVNDEVLEVNGIEVAGKTLDQVTDMMVANSAKLIITVKPMNQRNTLAGPNRASTISHLSVASSGSKLSVDSDEVHVFNKGDTDSSEDTTLPPSVEAAEIVLEEGYDEVDDGKEDKDSVIVTL